MSNYLKIILVSLYKLRDNVFPTGTSIRSYAYILFVLILSPYYFFKKMRTDGTIKFTYNLIKKPEIIAGGLESRVRRNELILFSNDIKIEKITSIEFPDNINPIVSIIIPVFNNWIYTYNCIASIKKNTNHIKYEIVLVDNASEDETHVMLKKIENAKKIFLKENKGFVGSCNIGAKSAEGKYLLFLNNDTQLTENSFKHMIETAENDTSVGIVGAKLIYPDGRLQEAGGIVWNDSKNIAWNYGKYGNPDKWEYNYIKEVDYCSGACFLIKKNIFFDVGLFDEQYSPAYCEDTDLSFSVRKAGYKVMYQPAAKVIHFEGITAGTDMSIGFKKYQTINCEKFYKKWKMKILNEHFKNGEHIFLARDRSKSKKIILYIDHKIPTFDMDAGSLITYEYLKLFVLLGYKIIFWPIDLMKIEPYTSMLGQMGIETVYGYVNFDKYIKYYGNYINFIFISRPFTANRYLDKVRSKTKAKIIYVAHDLHFLREFRRAEIENNEKLKKYSARLKRIELLIMRKSDLSLVFSNFEKDMVERENKNINIEVMPWIRDIDLESKNFEERSNIFFIGGFVHKPNQDGLIWFIKEVYPKIMNKIGFIKLIVIGSNPTEEILSLASDKILIKGYIPDVSKYFRESRVFIAPLRYGAGIKGKIIEAMSHGLPVVTTEIGAEGINIKNGENGLVARNAVEFSDMVTQIYLDKKFWDKISANGIKYISTNFSSEHAKTKIADMLK